MAARSHVDSGINERRLRPIYDCLDNGNNKKALQEADKLLKKQKDFLCAKALKALALVRLGRLDESFSAIWEVHVEDPIDDPTLQAMTICYRELHRIELIVDAYERASKKDPHNEELLSHLFMSHVRNSDYKKQQQVAMALYKLKPKNPYYFWAVMSIVMQANDADEKLAKQMLLPLAERMTEKFVKENKLEAEAEVQLYLMILEKQEKYDKAIEVLEGPLQEKLHPYQDSLSKRKAEYLVKLEKWPESNQAYKKLILGNPDQWSYFLEYFKTVCELVDSNWVPETEETTPEESVDYNFEKAVDFIDALVEEQNGARDGRRLRGPYLVQIHLLFELLKRGCQMAEKIGSVVEVLSNFYEKFGTKPSCFLDLSLAIKSFSLKDDEIKKVLEKIKASLVLENETEDIKLPTDLKQMNRHLCFSRLCHYYGFEEDFCQQNSLLYARELIERYSHALKFGSDLLSTEYQPADTYCLLACHVFIRFWEKTGDERFIAQVLILLEQSLKNSPSNFQLKLLLMKLYNIIGAVGASYNLYESIDVKHIQQETLGYLITEALPSAAFFTQSCTVLGNSIRFYRTNYKDIVDYLLSGYKFGSFTKIPELVNFREKVNNSLQYASVTVERMILDVLLESKSHQDTEKLVTNMEIDPEKDHRPSENLVDSRDIFVYRMYTNKERQILDEQISKSFQEKVSWLQIRNLILRILAAAFSLNKSDHERENEGVNNISNGEKHNMTDTLSKLIHQLKELATSVNTDTMISSMFPIQSPGVSRLYKYSQDCHPGAIVSMAGIVHNLHKLAEGISTDETDNKDVLDNFNYMNNFYLDSLKRIQDKNQNRDVLKPSTTKILLEDLSNITETLSFSTILVSICYSTLRPAWISLTRKGKKKRENVPQIMPEIFQGLTGLISLMKSIADKLLFLLKELELSQLITSLGVMSINEHINGTKVIQDDIVKQVSTNVEESYENSIKQLKELLSSKVKYLQSLKW